MGIAGTAQAQTGLTLGLGLRYPRDISQGYKGNVGGNLRNSVFQFRA